jgi:hypothetical protein
VASVPEDEESEDDGHCSESRSARAEDSSETVEENAEAANDERSQRDKKTVTDA